MRGAVPKNKHGHSIDVGMRVAPDGIPLRCVVAKKIDKVCLVYRDDGGEPMMFHVDDLEPIYVPA